MDDTATQLARARRGNDPDKLALALSNHADRLVKKGQIESAGKQLDEAAQIHHQANRAYDEARCSHLAATLYRFQGDFEAARNRLQRAHSLAKPGSAIAVSVATESAELALAEKDGSAAAAGYLQAINEGQLAGLLPTARASLLRKCATALVMAGEHHQAAYNLDAAYRLLLDAGERTQATRTLVEKAAALYQGNDLVESGKVRNSAIHEALSQSDDHALSDLYLLQATMDVDRHHLTNALKAAETARDYALIAVAPTSYISAVLALAEIHEAHKNHFATYEALVVGWVTLADLLGAEAAKELFEPKLIDLRQSWGVETFGKVKTSYETQRRAVM
jgi:hypothetical protein